MGYNFEKFEVYDAVATRRAAPVQSNRKKASSRRLSAAMKQSAAKKKETERRERRLETGHQQDRSGRQPSSGRQRSAGTTVPAAKAAPIYSFSAKEPKPAQSVAVKRNSAASRVQATSQAPAKPQKSIWGQFSVKSIVFCLLAVFAVFAVMINSQMQLTELADQINTSQVHLEDGQNRYTNLNLDAERRFNSDAEKIQQYAESHGMQKMGKHQLEGFEMTQGDKVEVLAKVDSQGDLWESVKEWFDNLLS